MAFAFQGALAWQGEKPVLVAPIDPPPAEEGCKARSSLLWKGGLQHLTFILHFKVLHM